MRAAAVAKVAREIARDCTQCFDEFLGEDPTYVHHPLAVSLLSKAGQLRAHVVEFGEGGMMSEMLLVEVSKLRCIPVVERSIEGKHSLISRRVHKHWRTGRTISLTLRMIDIKEGIARDPTFFNSLMDQFRLTRSPWQAAKQLGVHCHPDLELARRKKVVVR